LTKKFLCALKLLPTKKKLIYTVFKNSLIVVFLLKVSKKFREKISCMLEFPPGNNWTTFLDKLNISNDESSLAIHLLQIFLFIKTVFFKKKTVLLISGINFKRPGLSTILDQFPRVNCFRKANAFLDTCLQKTIGTIVIAHKERSRLCRFGYELIEELVKKAGGHIEQS
jgi:hypothetical protein